jgi:hypothetical protein
MLPMGRILRDIRIALKERRQVDVDQLGIRAQGLQASGELLLGGPLFTG